MQISAISNRNTSSQHSSVVCACKTRNFEPELQVSIGPRPHLSFVHAKTARFAPEILVSMCPSTDLLFLHAKQGILDQNYKSLWVPDLTCRLCMQNSAICTRTTSLCGSQTSPVFLCMKKSPICTRNTSLYGSQHSSVVFARKTRNFGPELQVSMGPRPHLSFVHAKQRDLHQNYKSLWVPDVTCRFVHEKQLA